MRTPTTFLLILLALWFSASRAQAQPNAPTAPALQTRWAAQVNPEAPLPEYPRPQLVRESWLNLNGRWQWSPAAPKDPVPVGKPLDRSIVVPFPIESSLSGVAEHHDRLWYRRTFHIPADWQGQRTMLNFGAVDWEASVYINGKKVGEHRGGYDPFSFDITDALNADGEQEIIVGIFDPTDAGQQPRGKQVRKPEGIWYTPCTGIWQTVWLEPVPQSHITSIEIVPDLAYSLFRVKVNTDGKPGGSAVVSLIQSGNVVNRHAAATGAWAVVKCGKPRLWSPEDPFLYDIQVEYSLAGQPVETVRSYAGLRSIALGKDAKGRTTLMLNGEPYFQVGPLDQGFWPDGIYTAPTDQALRYDIEVTKSLGFNMARKHVKVEPDRWYYWADTLGLLVWQDMPSSEPYIGPNDPDAHRSKESTAQYEAELTSMIAAHRNHPCIVIWVPFNEGWGQFDTGRIVDLVRKLDPSRLVNSASGWTDRKVGDVIDWHRYPAPGSPAPEPKRAAVLGEFGGLGLAIPGHLWKADHWGYKGMRDPEDLTRTYEKFLKDAYGLRESAGLSAIVYTQITDVEVECNGLLTYDRAVIKPDVDRIAAANRGDFSKMPPPPVVKVIVPTSQAGPQVWRYTTDAPPADWFTPGFGDAAWKQAPGGFGTRETPGAVVGTQWKTGAIWIRRGFELPSAPDARLHLRIHHDEDCEVYLNGVLALKLGGWTGEYEDQPISLAALAALKPGPNTIAITCKQTSGGQFIDAGLIEITPQPPPAARNAAPGAPADNLIPNSGFEKPAADRNAPEGWRISRWNGKGDLDYSPSEGRGSSAGLMIKSDAGGDLSWATNVPVEMLSRYKLSGWIRTTGVKAINGARGALFNVHGIDGAATRALVGDNDWTLVETEFDTGLNDSVTVNCLFGGWGLATGTACFDDVQLTLVKKGQLPEPRISVDASKVGEPISPYIYGQFIEHLGRCIYGGIWAEMLEDRKFFYAIDAKESPWKTLGSASVSMDDKGAFAGEHSPRITLKGDGTAGGIRQGALAIRPGKRYNVYFWLAGDSSAAPVEVSVRSKAWHGEGFPVQVQSLSADFVRGEFSFDVDPVAPGTDDAWLEISSSGKGSVRVGAVSLMPADNIHGFRADTLALLKELNSPVYRWPGGNFVSGYNWRDGIGDRDRRPPRKNPAWGGIEHNDVGVHEFLDLCDLLGTEPYIAINTGTGSVESAAAELEYLNGPAKSAMGQLRERNGRAQPWGVKYIGIGNEMYGDWQLGHVPLEQYLKRHAGFVEALRKVDPAIKVVGVGAVGDWSKAMLRENAGTMDYISEHVYWQGRDGLASHVKQAPDSLRRIAEAHRQYRRELDSLKGRNIRIVQDEWNYWYGPDIFGELGTRYFMKDALGCAAALQEFARNSDIFYMANYAQTVNVIGAIKTTRTSAALETTGLVLKLYRQRFGTLPVAAQAGPLLDVAAAWTQDHSAITIGIVNPTTQWIVAPLSLDGAQLLGGGRRYQIASPDPMAFNDPDKPAAVKIEESKIEGAPNSFKLPPCSVTIVELKAR